MSRKVVMHGSPSSAHLRIRTVASLQFVYLNYHYYRFLRLFTLPLRSIRLRLPILWKLSGETLDLIFFSFKRKKNGTNEWISQWIKDRSLSRRKTGCFAQPDTRNTINPALHVGVPAFRGTRNTRIPPLLNYDDELSP